MNHKVVVRALLEWFAIEVAVDVVLDLVSAGGVGGIRFCWRYVCDCVADCVESCYRFSVCC